MRRAKKEREARGEKALQVDWGHKKVKVDLEGHMFDLFLSECQVSMDHFDSLNYMLIYVDISCDIDIYIYIVWFLSIVSCHVFYLFSM